MSGNFLAVYGAGTSGQLLDFSCLPKGALNLKYFQMKHKKTAQRWFWVTEDRFLVHEYPARILSSRALLLERFWYFFRCDEILGGA